MAAPDITPTPVTKITLQPQDDRVLAAANVFRGVLETELIPIVKPWQRLSEEDRKVLIPQYPGITATQKLFRDFMDWLGVNNDTPT